MTAGFSYVKPPLPKDIAMIATPPETAKVADTPFPTVGTTTHHVLETPDGKCSYKATAEWTVLRKIYKPIAHIFHTAYFAESSDSEARPLTFVFNGGPGAASAYLHMGALGPKRIQFGAMGKLLSPPVSVVPNLESWLPFTDLVFIDPVGTGFSRALKEPKKEAKGGDGHSDSAAATDPEENADFWETERDLDSFGEFINRFLSKHHRWTSPCFIAGESYGGFRVAKMARKLQEKYGVGLCGALLISPAIELEALLGSDYDLTYWIELFPSLVATAHHHGRIAELPEDTSLSATLQRAEKFAKNDFARWLAHGESLQQEERTAIIAKIANWLGLPKSLIERSGGRVNATVFCRELLREQRKLCGHYDGSATTVDPFPDRNNYEGPDPTLACIDRIYTGAINHHLRSTLQLETDLEYRLLNLELHRVWKDKGVIHLIHKISGAMDDLRYGMSLNEHMKVLIAHGYFDLVTPYFSSQRLIDLMKLTPEQKQNLSVSNFHGGHMFYSWDDSRVAFRSQAQQFYRSAVR